jgi:hypothetical protein
MIALFHVGYRIRDQIVIEITSEKVREKPFTEGEALTLEQAARISQPHEYVQAQLRDSKSIDAINYKRHLMRQERNTITIQDKTADNKMWKLWTVT